MLLNVEMCGDSSPNSIATVSGPNDVIHLDYNV